MNIHRLYISCLTASLIALMAFVPSDKDPRIERLLLRLSQYYEHIPQQKVYLHLNKSYFEAEEHIWFKAYVVNAATHFPDSLSTNLYVELINPYGKVVDARLLRLEQGAAHADFFLGDTISDGEYQIRAFTNWMRNMDAAFFYTQNIRIKNDNSLYFNREDYKAFKRDRRTVERRSRKFDVQFFPEGGDLIAGLESVVAFKAIDENGKSIEISGQVIENKEQVVADFSSTHNGMGTFVITPKPDARYKVVVQTTGGKSKKFDLPSVLPEGYVMKVDNLSDKDSLKVRVTTNKPLTLDRKANTLILVGQSRGLLKYYDIVQLESASHEFSVPKDSFPSGIAQLTVFDGYMQPYCERLCFIQNNKDLLDVEIKTDKSAYGPREKVIMSMIVKNADGRAVSSRFSLAVTDPAQLEDAINMPSIYTNLLLNSDLKGKVENPDYYFDKANKQSKKELDILLLTQGWRRFLWQDVLDKNYPKIVYQRENGITIRGRLMRDLISVPYEAGTVDMTLLSEYNDRYSRTSDDKGYFVFDGMQYYDTLDVNIKARKENGRKSVVIEVFPTFPVLRSSHYTMHKSSAGLIANKGREGLATERTYISKEELRRREESRKRDNPLHEADQIIYMDDINTSGYHSILDILKGRVPGLSIRPNYVNIRGPSSILLQNEPLFLVDGMPVNKETANAIPPDAIERVEIVKGPGAAIYGNRGANGVIAIYTRKGEYMKKGELEFQTLGYYSAKDFYVPMYDTPEGDAVEHDHRQTLFWLPDVKTDEAGLAVVEFFTTDALPKGFMVDLQGIDNMGRIAFKQKVIAAP